MTNAKPSIRIWETTSLGLIILFPSGVLVSNQTGGYACLAPEEEGIYVPLRTEDKFLADFFTGPIWKGYCCQGIDERTTDFIYDYLHNPNGGELNQVTVDRTRLQDSNEAWIYVTITEPEGDSQLNLFSGFGSRTAVLTWQNSN